MTKSLCILILAFAFGGTANAQEYGAVIGVHQTSAETEANGVTVDGKLNFKAGLAVGFELVEKVKFRTGAIYNQRHFETKAGATEIKVNFDYLDIPANVQYGFNDMFSVFGGLTFAVNINDDVKSNVAGALPDPDTTKLVALLDVGVNMMFDDMIGFDFYYQRGLGGFADQLENYSTFGGNFLYWF